MFYNQPNFFGMDVGFETIKIAQAHKILGGFEISAKAEMPIPKGAISKNGITHVDEIASQIKTFLNNAKPHAIRSTRLYAALPESLTFTKTIIIPLTKPGEIAKAINLQAADALPISPEEVYKDFIVTKQGASSSEILLIAQDKNLINNFIEITEKAGLQLLKLETKQIALARLLVSVKNKSNIILVDIGTKVSKISLFEAANLITTATIEIGAQTIATGHAIELLSENIKKLEQFRASQLKQPVPISKVEISGAGAAIPAIDHKIQERLSIPVNIAKPIINIRGFEPKFAVAIGLALDEFL